MYQLKQKQISKLGFPHGILFEIEPSHSLLESMIGMQRVLYMLQQYPGRFSFEIWKDKNIGFRFFCSSTSVEGMLKAQLRSVYPQVIVKRSRTNIPSIKEGNHISACSFDLHGVELNLKRSGDFNYDPLRHILEAMNGHNSMIIVQFLFKKIKKIPKDKRIVLEQKYGDDLFFRDVRIPVLKCLVRIVTISNDKYKARESCDHIGRTFSVFDSDRCQLHPRVVSHPLIRNSYDILVSVTKRIFPIFSKPFMISVPELASMVHLPVGAESCGIEYSKSFLTPPHFIR